MTQTALLLLDVQDGLLSTNQALQAQPGVIERIHDAVLTARAAGHLIVAVTVGYRQAYPEIPARNQFFGQVPATGGFIEGSGDLDVHGPAVPGGPDVVVRKRRQDAFFGTDLEIILRAAGAERLVLAGFTTSGGVLATVKAASDRDYVITVLADACADSDPELHDMVVRRIFAAHATIADVEEWRREQQASSAQPRRGAPAGPAASQGEGAGDDG